MSFGNTSIDEPREQYVVVRAGAHLCALLLEHVEETMRPLPVRAFAGGPSFVLGLSAVRGLTVPVVDAASLLEGPERPGRPARFVLLKAAEKRIALAVDDVIGVRQIGRKQLQDLPPLLAAACNTVVEAIATLDRELLVVLSAGKLVPDVVWSALESGDGP